MDINLIGFDVTLGREKPRTLLREGDVCPFCDVKNLRGIVETQGEMIFLKNKYNVIQGADQFLIIETDICHSDMPDYTKEHMRNLIRFAVKHWQNMINSGKYEVVLMFKNYGPLSGGTIRHPHMQIVGFPKLNSALLFNRQEFGGRLIAKKNGVELNAADCPRIGFGELNILPHKESDMDTLADFVQVCVDYLMNHFNTNCKSYNIFFYYDEAGIYIKILPRFATSPLFIGYNIHFLPNNLDVIVRDMQSLYAHVLT